MKELVPVLENFMHDEQRHLEIFWKEIQSRNGIKCKSYILCGVGGYVMGMLSALLGRRGIMACTWAVESVVIYHLEQQLVYLEDKSDADAFNAVQSILNDEKNHRDVGFAEGGSENIWYKPLRYLISSFTEGLIRFGMR